MRRSIDQRSTNTSPFSKFIGHSFAPHASARVRVNSLQVGCPGQRTCSACALAAAYARWLLPERARHPGECRATLAGKEYLHRGQQRRSPAAQEQASIGTAAKKLLCLRGLAPRDSLYCPYWSGVGRWKIIPSFVFEDKWSPPAKMPVKQS